MMQWNNVFQKNYNTIFNYNNKTALKCDAFIFHDQDCKIETKVNLEQIQGVRDNLLLYLCKSYVTA